MRFPFIVTVTLLVISVCNANELTREQRLIVACYRVDVEVVARLLRDGANVNARFGDANEKLLQDPWDLGYPAAAKQWTPLIALASSSSYPDPARKVENTSADLDWARDQKAKIPPDQIEQRKRNALTIALILLSHGADIDADDGYGATPLYEAIYLSKLELAKQLLRFNAKVNTKTGVYIDGDSGITPLHRASYSAELTKLLLEKGADRNAKDSRGRTPRDWASGDPAVQKLYEQP